MIKNLTKMIINLHFLVRKRCKKKQFHWFSVAGMLSVSAKSKWRTKVVVYQRKSGKLPWGHHINATERNERKTSPRVSARQNPAKRSNLFEVIKKNHTGRGEEMRGWDAGNVTSQYSDFVPLRRLVFGEVRFSEQETDLERKSLSFIYITDIFDRKQLGQHLSPPRPKLFIKGFGHMFKSRHFFFSPNGMEFGSLRFGSHQTPPAAPRRARAVWCLLGSEVRSWRWQCGSLVAVRNLAPRNLTARSSKGWSE